MSNLKIRVFFVCSVCLFLISCANKIVVTPDKLHDAVIGQQYYSEIKITGGTGAISSSSFNYTITPDKSGLELYFLNPNSAAEFNQLIVKGTPLSNIIKEIKINISGETLVSTPWKSPTILNKTYIIKVKESE